MTFDAWIARITGAQRGSSGTARFPARPVRDRRLKPEPCRIAPHRRRTAVARSCRTCPVRAAAFRTAGAGRGGERAAARRAPAKPQRAVPRICASRASLLQTTATGAVQFVRTSEAELAPTRRARPPRPSARPRNSPALAAAEKERAKRNPGWCAIPVRPISMLRATPAKEDVPPAKAQEIETDPHEPSAPDASGTPGPDIAAIVDLVNDLHRNVPRARFVEILIPRTATMARTDVFSATRPASPSRNTTSRPAPGADRARPYPEIPPSAPKSSVLPTC